MQLASVVPTAASLSKQVPNSIHRFLECVENVLRNLEKILRFCSGITSRFLGSMKQMATCTSQIR